MHASAPSGNLKSTPSEPEPLLAKVNATCFGFDVLSESFVSRLCGLTLVKLPVEVIVPLYVMAVLADHTFTLYRPVTQSRHANTPRSTVPFVDGGPQG